MRAERLSEVINMREDEVVQLKTTWAADMTLRAVRTESAVSLPPNAEELRLRVGIMGVAWQFIAYQHPPALS